MSYWKLAILLLTSCATAPSTEQSSANLLDGKPRGGILSGGVEYKFDGVKSLTVAKGNKELSIDPKTPSVIASSSDGKFLILNYGDGSGQVYSISLYDLARGHSIALNSSISTLVQYAKSKNGCAMNADEISIIFEKSEGPNDIILRTEDFSRKENCGHVNRLWKLNIAKASHGSPAITSEQTE